MSWLFTSGGRSIGALATASVLPVNIQDWFPLGWTGWISLQRRDSQESSPTPQFKSINSSALSFHVHPYMTTGKTIALTIRTFVGKAMCLLFNMHSRFVIALLPRSTCLNFMAAAIVCSDCGAQENKVCHCFRFSPSVCHEVMGLNAVILVFWMLNFKPGLSLSSFALIKRLHSSSPLSAIRVVSFAYLRLLIFSRQLDSSLWFIQPGISHDVLGI